MKNAVETASREFGEIEILLNNAGIAVLGGVTELTPEELIKFIDITINDQIRGALQRNGSSRRQLTLPTSPSRLPGLNPPHSDNSATAR